MSSRIEAQRKRWHKEIEAWRESGKTLSAWARERGHSRAMQSSAPIELRTPIELVVGTARVMLAPGFDPAGPVQVLQVLQARC